MGKWMFACAVVTVAGFLAEPAQAQEVITTAPKAVTSAETVTVTPRGGVLQRLRERRGMTVVSQSVTTAPAVATTTTPGTVVQAQATQTPAAVQTQVVETRQGILVRLRDRRVR